MQITLANLKDATEQQIFDQVARHLLKQGVRAVADEVSDKRCQYRTGSGLMCAAGCLIADDEYDPEFDVAGNWERVARLFPTKVTHVHQYFINQLQKMHDLPPTESIPLNFAERLAKFAVDHRLQFNLEELSK